MPESGHGSTRDAVRWGLLLAAVAVSGYRLPGMFRSFQQWRGAMPIDPSAAELYKTTGTAAYKTYVESNYKAANTADNGFQPLLNSTPYFDASLASDLNRAYVTYATTTGASPTIVTEIRNALKNNLDPNGFLQVANYNGQADPYRAFMWSGHYTWGSNQLKAQWATVLTFAIRLNVGF